MGEKVNEVIEKATVKGNYLMYKGRPLVRENNTICYGNMDDEYVLCLTIMSECEQDGKQVPDMVLIQIVNARKDRKAGYKERPYRSVPARLYLAYPSYRRMNY